jgi:hypothetical protein
MILLLLTSLAWGTPEAVHVVEHYTKEYQTQCIDTIIRLRYHLEYHSVRMEPTRDKHANKIHFKMIDKRGEQFECTATLDTFIDGLHCDSDEWGYTPGCLGGISYSTMAPAPTGGGFSWSERGSSFIIHYKITSYEALSIYEAVNSLEYPHPALQALTATFINSKEEKE